jgi:EAL domain-containing protein (putative c-di-GMP-specific phosphodiesterase class I)
VSQLASPHRTGQVQEGPQTAHAAVWDQHTLHSHFQPIFSLPLGKRVGHEALLRPRAADGQPVSPLQFLQMERDLEQLLLLDQTCHALHLDNFLLQSRDPGWLFLNMHPEMFLRAPYEGFETSFGNLLDELDFPPEQLVVEVLEGAVRENAAFAHAVAYFRELGCLIALDDFGAGHSNFDRVWRIQPEIVKLDRSLITQAARDTRVRRILPQMVSLLHEAGAMVLMEGIETLEEAHIALDSDVDFVQGFYFGRPESQLADLWQARVLINGTWVVSDQLWQDERINHHQEMAPYQSALAHAAALMAEGKPIAEACTEFLQLPDAQYCYLLDGSGRQIGENIWGAQSLPTQKPQLAPLGDTRNARWSRRPYFSRAIEQFGRVQITRPYLSLSVACLCRTTSMAFRIGNDTFVICGDVRTE